MVQPRISALIALTTVAVLLVVSVGCERQEGRGGAAKANSPDRLAAIQSRGELRVGYLVWEPCIARGPSPETPTGLYADMVDEIAKALKVRVSWHETTLANFAAGLASDQFDIFVGAVFITMPRAASVAFTKPIAFVGNSGVVRADGQLHPARIEDLDSPTVRIAVLQGQAVDEYCRRYLPQAQLVVLAGGDLTAPLTAVSSNQADIGFMNSVTVAKYCASHPELRPVFTGADQIELLPLAWAVRHDDQRLLTFLNASLEYLRSTGRISESQKKYPIKLLYEVPRLESAEPGK